LPSLLHFQLIIDIVFFIIIMLLLRQLNNRMIKTQGDGDGVVEQFKKIMAASQDSVELFLRAIQESEERLNNVARKLDGREKKIIILIDKAESLIQKLKFQGAEIESDDSDGGKYEQIARMVQDDLSREEVAVRLGITRGEVDLIVELEQARVSHP
jgi:hypothetical protein